MSYLYRRITLFVFLLLSTHALAGTILESQTFQSDALGKLTYSIFLPDSYDSDSRAYPVIYLLHGYGGSDTDWVRFGDVAFTAEQLIPDNQIPPMIIVMPDGKDSWYVPSKVFGDVERAFTKDLVAHIDATYRTIPERTSRAIGGLSMGGYGAAYLAFNHPDLYAAVGIMSGALFQGVPPLDNAGIARETLFAGAFGKPFNPALWKKRNPFAAIKKLAKAEESLAVYITVGDDDIFAFYKSSTSFYTALQNAKIPSQLPITDGGHTWAVWSDALPKVLVFFADSFEAYY